MSFPGAKELEDVLRDLVRKRVASGAVSVEPQAAPSCDLKNGEHGGDVRWMVRDYSPNNGPLRAAMCAKHRADPQAAAYGWRLEDFVLRRYRVAIR